MKEYRHIFLILLAGVISHLSYSQKIGNPKDLKTAISFLQTDCPDSIKTIIKKTKDDSLTELVHYPWDGEYKTIYEWTMPSKRKYKISAYLKSKGISSILHQQTAILLAFKMKLLGQTIEENEIIKPYKLIELKWAKEDSVRFTTDTLRGVYIPKNLEDCIRKIDGFWSDSIKMKVRQWTEDEFVGKVHLGFGMWMRNNWQLWGGSRLSKYFNEKGIYHPDDISGIILVSYLRHLKGQDINLEEQVKSSQYYWKVVKAPSKDIYPKGVKKLEFNQGQHYNLKEGNTQGFVHIQTNSKSDKTWIYDLHYGWKLLSYEELKELDKTDYSNREETLNKLYKKTPSIEAK